MPKTLVAPDPANQSTMLCLQHDLEEILSDWGRLRGRMARHVAEPFTRDEWAYLIQFVDPAHLRCFLTDAFSATQSTRVLYRSRSPVAVWLPNNVSLLGPLVVVLLSLGGARLRLKSGSSSDDLASAFVDWARDELPSGALATYLRHEVEMRRFDREDPLNADYASTASLRIVFGNDETIRAVDALPHPPRSIGVGFSDRQSEAWLDEATANDEAVLRTLIRVFAIYGQAGCTSPRRVVLVGGTAAESGQLCEKLVDLWPSTVPGDPPMHLASENVMARQWAAAEGWSARCCDRNAAVIAHGPAHLVPIAASRALFVVGASEAEALATMPRNIQTVGVALGDIRLSDELLLALVERGVARVVPLARMHHFGARWDGYELLREMFEAVVVES